MQKHPPTSPHVPRCCLRFLRPFPPVSRFFLHQNCDVPVLFACLTRRHRERRRRGGLGTEIPPLKPRTRPMAAVSGAAGPLWASPRPLTARTDVSAQRKSHSIRPKPLCAPAAVAAALVALLAVSGALCSLSPCGCCAGACGPFPGSPGPANTTIVLARVFPLGCSQFCARSMPLSVAMPPCTPVPHLFSRVFLGSLPCSMAVGSIN